MSSLFKNPITKPNLGRNGFDVSRRRIFTSPTGMLLPVYDDFANPGDKYKINSSAFIRTDAVETSAFVRLKHHLDWFFVPITQIYSFWNEFFNGTQDVMTSFVTPSNTPNNAVSYNLPLCDFYGILSFGQNSYFISTVSGTGSEGRLLYFDSFGVPYAHNMRRLVDLLGYGSISRMDIFSKSTLLPDASTVTCNFFPLKFLVYHKIFHSHYLNSQFFVNDPSLYNVDKYYGHFIPEDVASKIMSTIHYRPYRKDYFTNVFPSPSFSQSWVNAVSSPLIGNPNSFINGQNVSQDSINNSVSLATFGQNIVPDSDGSLVPSGATTPGSALHIPGTGSVNVGVGNIRQLFAYDRLMRITASAGSHYADQTLAHFGVKLPEGISNEAYFLGEQITDIVINEVVATANTSVPGDSGTDYGSVLGDIAGKGFGVTTPGKDIEFTCPCHGMIMAISSIEPVCDYASMAMERFNRYKTAFDFYRPEFDNLGMQPAYNNDFYHSVLGTVSRETVDGWQYRFSELKTKFDVVNESIWDTWRHIWSCYKQSLGPDLYDPAFGNGFSLDSIFYIAPQYTNNIFLRKFPYYGNIGDNTLHLDVPASDSTTFNPWYYPEVQSSQVYTGDNFLLNLDMRVFKTSCMSVHSLPKYI